MIQNSNVTDLLIVEENENVIYLFKEISKIFDLKIEFVKNLDEFVNVILEKDFQFILCNMHVENYFSGLFLSRLYDKIRKNIVKDAQLFFYSFQNNKLLELSKFILDDLSETRYANFYDFMHENFPMQFLQYFTSEQFKLSITA